MENAHTKLLRACDLDAKLRYPRGRSARLARKGLIPHIVLPDGEIRFDPKAVDAWLRTRAAEGVRDER